MTSILLSEALHNMLLYLQDEKREKEAQDLNRFKTAVVQAAVNSAFTAPEKWKNKGAQYVLVCHAIAVSEVSRTVLHIFSS